METNVLLILLICICYAGFGTLLSISIKKKKGDPLPNFTRLLNLFLWPVITIVWIINPNEIIDPE